MPRRIAALLVTLTLAVACLHNGQAQWLGSPKSIAPGVDLFQTRDSTLVEAPAPGGVVQLRVDPEGGRIEKALSNDEVMEAERVDGIAKRRNAIAAVNAGFFNVKNGEPTGVLKIAGELVSDTTLTRGALAIHSPPGGRQHFYFDQASAKVVARFRAGAEDVTVALDGVDPTRERGSLMLYTPAYHGDTDTAPNGTEWVLDGNPLAVIDIRKDRGRTPIPRTGAVLSFGGLELTPPLALLARGTAITFETTWKVLNGTPVDHFEQARDVVSGAGLLMRDGAPMSGWLASENLQPATFTDVRHPRTLVGVDRKGLLWLVAIDGRQPDHSVGMTFAELLTLCKRLDLVNALNLDGGGSTTMVVSGLIVNKPSDATGPRPVSDAIVVRPR